MPDYLEFSQDTGLILKKLISVDPSRVEGLTVKEMDRDSIEKLDIATKKIVNGEVVDKTQAELDADKKAKDDDEKDKSNKRLAVIEELKGLGLSNEAIAVITGYHI